MRAGPSTTSGGAPTGRVAQLREGGLRLSTAPGPRLPPIARPLPGDLVALVGEGVADGGGADGGLVVGDPDGAGTDVDGGLADPGEAADGGLDGAAAVVAGDVRDRQGLGDHGRSRWTVAGAAGAAGMVAEVPGRRGDRARAAARATTARAARPRRRRRVAAGRAGVKARSCREQATTNTLDRLMAAAATNGWRRPVAARGTAATL